VIATARSFILDGVAARSVRVEVDVHKGLPAFSIVGLPDAAVREARERVRAAIVNCGFEFPLRRITVNLAPASLRKGGPALDLAIAAALLAASDQLSWERLARVALAGELALDGSLRRVAGAVAMAEAARARGLEAILVPEASAGEAALIDGLEVLPLASLSQLMPLAAGEWQPPPPAPVELLGTNGAGPDLADLRGQPGLRRALEVAAAGGHSVLMIGPPGGGKSLAARRVTSTLPPLTRAEALEVARVASACGTLDGGLSGSRPFRAPHHTISAAGLVGGGSPPRAGEITLAHRGVLFLDELCEFDRNALEALREPLESGSIAIARAGSRSVLPCRFMLVAAANPCPCGRGEHSPGCNCGPHEVRRYESRLSGALADRLDIVSPVGQPAAEEISGPPGETSAQVRERVVAARARQHERLGSGRCNAEMTPQEARAGELSRKAREVLRTAYGRDGLSGRAHDRVLRLARTVADLAGSEQIGADEMLEALSLRRREPG
jgi:magnesium chelatase family protein